MFWREVEEMDGAGKVKKDSLQEPLGWGGGEGELYDLASRFIMCITKCQSQWVG